MKSFAVPKKRRLILGIFRLRRSLTEEVKSYAEPGLDNVKIQSSQLHRVRIISQREFNPEVLQAKYCSKRGA